MFSEWRLKGWEKGWVGWVLWHINFRRLFNTKSIFMQIVQFQTIQFSISTQFNCQKTFLFQAIQLIQIILIQLIWPIDWTLSDATI